MWRFNMMDLARNRRRRSQSFPSSRREFPQFQPLISQRSSSCPELYQSSISPTRDPAARIRRRRSQSFPSSRRESPQLQPLISQRSSSCPELYQSSISPTRDPAVSRAFRIRAFRRRTSRATDLFCPVKQSSPVVQPPSPQSVAVVTRAHTRFHTHARHRCLCLSEVLPVPRTPPTPPTFARPPPQPSFKRRSNVFSLKHLADLSASFGRTQDTDEGAGLKSSSANTNISDEKKIIYQNNSTVWNCEEHNFSMTFQSESLPTGTYESTVEISVTPGEDYVLPVLTVPVSMFFAIKCQLKFYKNVLVSIEHFSAETNDLSFVVSSNPQPPFHFELLSGGEFNTKRCGKIDRCEFSILGIVMTRIRTGRWPRMLYYCALYTSPPVDNTWTVYIYITKDSATYRHRIKEDTRVSERTLNTETLATVNHTIDYFDLDISMKAEEISQGWLLTPEGIDRIRIPRRRIDRCRGDPRPANFKIILDVSKNRGSCKFVHGYKIADVDQENTLSLVLSPQILPARQESERSVIESLPRQESENSATESLSILDLEELQRQRSKLVTGLKFEMNWLASELAALGILSTQHQNDIANTRSTLNQDERANIMVSAIMDKLELDSNNLRLILKVLRKKPILYKETIALLEDKKLWKTK